MIISTESGALGSLTTRLRCGGILLMVATSKPSLFAGLDTSIGLMQYEQATIQESPCIARIAWADQVSKAGRQQLHGALVASLSEAGDAQGVREMWHLGLLFSGCIASLQSKGLIQKFAHNLPTEPPPA